MTKAAIYARLSTTSLIPALPQAHNLTAGGPQEERWNS